MISPRHYRLRHYLQPGALFHLSRAVKTSREEVPLHDHDFAEIFWISGNPCQHRLNGAEEELIPGDLLFIRPRDVHAFCSSRGRTWTIHNLAFPESIWVNLAAHLEGQALPYTSSGPQPERMRLSSSQLEQLNSRFSWLTTLPGSQLALEWFIYAMLLDATAPYKIDLPSGTPEWLVETCRLIVAPENFSQGPQHMARLARRSPEHLSRTVRGVLGMTPGELINQLRLQYACRQLEFTNEPINNIAQDCGLANLSYFYRLFAKKFNMTPAAWRAQRRSRNPV